ncbi:hypothetical protein [Streptomyces mirabilis]|uniref:hypothetical protein n=1 Tax=Streptomyces mirabilis TaxID=68239 RepID=UPI0037F6F365
MNLPAGVPVFKLRDAIAGALWAHVKANRLAAVCGYLGLAPQRPDEDPYNSKRSYVHARLEDKPLPDLMAIARRVVAEYGDDDLQQLLAQMGLHGVSGELKNLIFAADGPKPQIVLPDSISNTIRIVKNEQYCLVYDQRHGQGIRQREAREQGAERTETACRIPQCVSARSARSGGRGAARRTPADRHARRRAPAWQELMLRPALPRLDDCPAPLPGWPLRGRKAGACGLHGGAAKIPLRV